MAPPRCSGLRSGSSSSGSSLVVVVPLPWLGGPGAGYDGGVLVMVVGVVIVVMMVEGMVFTHRPHGRECGGPRKL